MSPTTPSRDVLVLGDGPAGAVIAHACRRSGLDVALVGDGAPWTATYATWVDDVAGYLPPEVFAARCDRVVVAGRRERAIDRAYGVLDGAALRRHLGADELLLPGRAVSHAATGRSVDVELSDGTRHRAAFVIDATGSPADARPVAWQTAYGVVVDAADLPADVTGEAATLMRWSGLATRAADDLPPTFLYVVPVGEGWLVEETVLAARRAVAPDDLRARLVERLGGDVVARSEAAGRVERVRIPMGLVPVRPDGRVVPFGAAAGMIHPATGYSVAASVRAADRVAGAIRGAVDGGDPSEVATAVWPRPARRARRLHDYGLRALLELDAGATADFFDAFFDLPVDVWSEYLRVDTTPQAVAAVMRRVFAGSPWSVRAKLVGAGPLALARRLGRR